jgi:UDP-glucuronate decarboxylase
MGAHSYMRMKIIVSGGAGFIGSHLCDRLIENGDEVYAVDNFITGNRKNLSELEKKPAFHMIEKDINEPFDAESIKKIGKIDRIFHLACPASPLDYKEIPLQTLWVSAAGTKNMLELAVKNDASILVASTSEIYGDPQQHPQKESYFGNVNPIGERSCYNEGKRYAESLAINYWKHYKFPLKIVRIFNTYGPRMRKNDGRAIPEFINKALSGEPVQVNGDGSQTRSFCYIDDMVDGLLAVMETDPAFTGPVNLGNPSEISIMDLVKIIIKLTGSESKIIFAKYPEDDPVRRQPDITLARQMFDFSPGINLENGLKKTIASFQAAV